MTGREDLLRPLNEATLCEATRFLSKKDPDLARVVEEIGPPPFWSRPPGFPTLVQIILEQQVSLSSARVTFERLSAVTDPLTAARLLALDETDLKKAGLSRQKARYTRLLAEAVVERRLDLEEIAGLADDKAGDALRQITGIGHWSANIYLLMALRRPDAWPSGDLALAIAVGHVKNMKTRPLPAELEAMSTLWSPWRAVAARIFWHYYLSGKVPRS